MAKFAVSLIFTVVFSGFVSPAPECSGCGFQPDTTKERTEVLNYNDNLSMLEVKTKNGPVKGILGNSCRTQNQFAKFRGIPYAEPPVGELRFKDPVEKKPWTGVWDATKQSPGCFQSVLDEPSGKYYSNNETMSEDCLYLNVYTPNLNYLKYKVGPLKPVMIYIHHGAFIMGSGSEKETSPDFLVDKDVLLVTFNYRLGPLGFLTLQNAEVPGNAGLKDQNLVLKWVKKNIRNFGGDPNQVTIFGESAGSASVSYHLLSPLSDGLFRSAIMESGTALSPWAYSPPELALKKAHSLGEKVNCKNTKDDEFLKCMQAVPAEKLINLQHNALTLQELFTIRIVAFHPTTEPDVPGAFLTGHPFNMFYEGNFTKVPTIIGANSNEGLLFYSPIRELDPYGILLNFLGWDLSKFAPYNFHIQPFSKLAKYVHNQISEFYFESKPLSRKSIDSVLELIQDTNFFVPIQLTAAILAEHNVPVYNYEFTYQGKYAKVKVSMGIMDVPGVCHGDELGYIFYVPEINNCNASKNISDELTIDRMTTMWSNFAKTGNPTPKKSKNFPEPWKLFTTEERNYYEIGGEIENSDNMKLTNIIFWDHLIRKIMEELNMRVKKLGNVYVPLFD